MAKQYLDLTGLQSVIGQIKAYYAATTKADAAGRVGWATNAVTAETAVKAGQLAAENLTIGVSGDIISSTAQSFDGTASITIPFTIADVVASTAGAGGSHGLMTAAQAEKLAGIATGAQVNVLEDVSVVSSTDSAATTITKSTANKAITITLPQYALKAEVAAGINFRGVVASTDNLPSSGNHAGDIYIVTGASADANTEYIWVDDTVTGGPASGYWEALGSTTLLTNYYTKTEVDTTIASRLETFATANFDATGVAKAATKLQTARTIDFTGDVSGTQISFDGTTAVSTTLTIAAGAVTKAKLHSDLQAEIDGKMVKATTGSDQNKIATFDANGNLVAGTLLATQGSVSTTAADKNGLVTGAQVATAIESASTALVEALDVTTTTGAYLTSIGEQDGKLVDLVWGTVAASTTTSTTTDFRFASAENSKLVSAGEVTKVLDGDGYITAIPSASLSGLFA